MTDGCPYTEWLNNALSCLCLMTVIDPINFDEWRLKWTALEERHLEIVKLQIQKWKWLLKCRKTNIILEYKVEEPTGLN